MINILILGSGGREHALAQKISSSKNCKQLFVAPGNAGTSSIAKNLDISPTDFDAIASVIQAQDISMLIVGPEAPLVNGITDYFSQKEAFKDLMVIGPSQKGANLEGSKKYAKAFMDRQNIPTARYRAFSKENLEEGYQFLESLQAPYVLKADGLAGGKGVLILDNLEQAKKELALMLKENKFGDASKEVVIEEFLDGIELSVFVLTDGKDYLVLPNAKDYKRIGEGDTGLNTGGMGAISPVPFADDNFMQQVENKIIKPTIQGFQKEDIPYKGFVFIGLMKVGNEPYVVEYNVRMGDPETEVVMPRIQSDLVEVLTLTAQEKLSNVHLKISNHAAATVMLVSGGYPEDYQKNKIITGLDVEKEKDIFVFHAGTKSQDKAIQTNGGRVIAITALGEVYQEAVAKSYKHIKKLHFEGMYYRKDIGFDL